MSHASSIPGADSTRFCGNFLSCVLFRLFLEFYKSLMLWKKEKQRGNGLLSPDSSSSFSQYGAVMMHVTFWQDALGGK